MEGDVAVGGGVHLLTSSWQESWQWHKAAERNLSVLYVDRRPFTADTCTQRLTWTNAALLL